MERLVRWLRANQDRYAEPYVTYPGGPPPLRDDGGATPVQPTTVTVVGTVLDPAVAERELRAVYRGNLCVVPARHPGATLTAVTDRATDGPAWSAHGVFAAAPDSVTGTVTVRLVVVDAAARRWLRQVDDRTGTVAAHPWVRPLRPR